MKISIICTVKNGENTIKETIESIINQSYKFWEMIVVDDGSTDATIDIVLAFIAIDKRIKLLPTSGVGRAKALNLAIESTKGEYIVNIDIDDPVHPNKLETQLKCFENNSHCALIGTDSEFIIGNNKPSWEEIDYQEGNIQIVNEILPYRNPLSHSSIMIKANILKECGGYNEGLSSQVDYDLWIRLAEKNYLLGYFPYKLSSKRIHQNQSFENKKRLKYLIGSFKVRKSAIKRLKVPLSAYLYLYISFFYGLFLPQSVRTLVRRLLKGLKILK